MDFTFQPPVFGAASSGRKSLDLGDIFDGNFFESFGAADGDFGAALMREELPADFAMSQSQPQKQELEQEPEDYEPEWQGSLTSGKRGVKEERKRKASGAEGHVNLDKLPISELTEEQKIERRERNREHAKRSRVRKKFMLDCLQDQLLALRKENMNLRQVVKEHMPEVATQIFEKCVSEKALVLSADTGEAAAGGHAAATFTSKKPDCLLVEPDFQLISALMDSQQNFTISNPHLPDNPIVYASQGFLKLTGYSIEQVIGRNCRFLQGPGTDPRAVDIIRRGVAEGRDTSVCLLNYRADGTPFWNNFFVGALRDQQGRIVNHVGVQAEVKQSPPEEFREKVRKMPLPEELMH